MDPNVEKILKLPTKQKIMIVVLVALIEVGALGYFVCWPKYQELDRQKVELQKLNESIAVKTKDVSNLSKLEKEYARLVAELNQALRELPNSKEIPDLLTTITKHGKDSGLDFLTFRPKPEAPKGFFAEVPVDVVVSGSFTSVANFFVKVASLDRIVNISNVAFSDIKSVGNRSMMVKVTCLATTFRFLDEKEIKDDKKTAAKK